jgi:hypothetical protein
LAVNFPQYFIYILWLIVRVMEKCWELLENYWPVEGLWQTWSHEIVSRTPAHGWVSCSQTRRYALSTCHIFLNIHHTIQIWNNKNDDNLMLFLTQKQLQKGKLKTKLRLNPASVVFVSKIALNYHHFYCFKFELCGGCLKKYDFPQYFIYILWLIVRVMEKCWELLENSFCDHIPNVWWNFF